MKNLDRITLEALLRDINQEADAISRQLTALREHARKAADFIAKQPWEEKVE
jgi:hypothetical protein